MENVIKHPVYNFNFFHNDINILIQSLQYQVKTLWNSGPTTTHTVAVNFWLIQTHHTSFWRQQMQLNLAIKTSSVHATPRV